MADQTAADDDGASATFGAVSSTVWDSDASGPGGRGDIEADLMSLDSSQLPPPKDDARAQSSAVSGPAAVRADCPPRPLGQIEFGPKGPDSELEIPATHTRARTCTCTCTRTHAQAHTNARMRARTHTHTRTQHRAVRNGRWPRCCRAASSWRGPSHGRAAAAHGWRRGRGFAR